MPATDERRPTSSGVLKKKYAMAAVQKPGLTVPLESAAKRILTIRNTMRRIGSSVSATDKSIRSSCPFSLVF